MRDLFKLAASVVAMVAILIGYSVFLSQTSAPAQAVQSMAVASQCCACPTVVAESPTVVMCRPLHMPITKQSIGGVWVEAIARTRKHSTVLTQAV
jgi:hypothetical protein